MWDFCEESTQTAKKHYTCDGCEEIKDAIDDVDWEYDFPFHPRDIAIIKCLVFDRNCSIFPGEEYNKLKGKWRGEWTTYRSLPIADKIIEKYDMYREEYLT
jgi:hypothetical protein